MAQQEQGSERVNRLASLRTQIGTKGQQATPETREEVLSLPQQQRAEQSAHQEQSEIGEQKSERTRHTLYYSEALNKRIDGAFKRVVHDIFPVEIEKSDFLEACFKYCLANMSDIQALLQQRPHEE